MAQEAPGRIVHVSPSRVRMRIHRDYRTPDTFDRIRQTLREVEGVLDVETNTATGSVLVRLDPEIADATSLLKLGAELGLLGAEGAGAPPQVDVPKVIGSALVLGAAAVGAAVGPRIGLSRRLAALASGLVAVAVERNLGRLGLSLSTPRTRHRQRDAQKEAH